MQLECSAIKSALETAQAHVDKAKSINLSEDIIAMVVKTKVNEYQQVYTSLENNRKSMFEVWNIYIDRNEHILRRQVNCERKFFQALYCRSHFSYDLAKELFKRRILKPVANNSSSADDVENSAQCVPPSEPIDLTLNAAGIGGFKRMVVAERALLDIAIEIYGAQTGPLRCQRTGWSAAISPRDTANRDLQESAAVETSKKESKANSSKEMQVMEVTATESLLIGSMTVIKYKHKTNPRLVDTPLYLRGDDYYHMEELGNSNDILSFLNHFTMVDVDAAFVENEKKLAQLMIDFCRTGRFISLESLQNVNEDATEKDVSQLMRICYHYFVKRIIPWMVTDYQPVINEQTGYKMQQELPLCSGQLRSLLLIRLGLLSFTECFDITSDYGIFHFIDRENLVLTLAQLKEKDAQKHSNNPAGRVQHTYESLRNVIININSLYQKAVLENSEENFIPYMQFWKVIFFQLFDLLYCSL